MIIQTHLISGAGNTFHIVYCKNQIYKTNDCGLEQKKTIAKEICKNKISDGFIFLEKLTFADIEKNYTEKHISEYQWSFFNNDGSNADMCGNATRCVGYYIKNILNDNGIKWKLLTEAGTIIIEFVSAESYKITMTPIQQFESNLGFYCNTGVPHLVLETEDILITENLLEAARQLRMHSVFRPQGTNVTYVNFDKKLTKLKAISYERGVENFTAACGTGAVAAAYFNLTKRGVQQTQVEMPGGTLMIDLSDLNRPMMTGPATLLGSYKYEVSI